MPKRRNKMEFENGFHADDIRAAAIRHITMFFQGKSWYCGGTIPQRHLLSDSSIKTVLRTRFDKDWEEFVHHECLTTIPVSPEYKLENLLPWAVRCLIDLLESMEPLLIPKEFRPGLTLLYFKFCKGVKIPPPPPL